MPLFSSTNPKKRRWTWMLALAGLIGLGVWLGWLDSHSLSRRWRWHQAVQRVHAKNDTLRTRIHHLQHTLDQPLTDRAVEHIAREQYGMHRPDETVYRVRPTPDSP